MLSGLVAWVVAGALLTAGLPVLVGWVLVVLRRRWAVLRRARIRAAAARRAAAASPAGVLVDEGP
ncbi:hypothetical protein Cma02nite_14910 [Cellulomonas marina]|nr:hypothetical protein Cma02nite_14910 [Cellulomonas marina]